MSFSLNLDQFPIRNSIYNITENITILRYNISQCSPLYTHNVIYIMMKINTRCYLQLNSLYRIWQRRKPIMMYELYIQPQKIQNTIFILAMYPFWLFIDKKFIHTLRIYLVKTMFIMSLIIRLVKSKLMMGKISSKSVFI